MSAPLLLSTCLQLVVVIVYQRAALYLLAAQPGYERFRGDKGLQDVVVSEAMRACCSVLRRSMVQRHALPAGAAAGACACAL